MWHMSKVKRFQARIECMKLKNTFGEMADLVTRDLGIFAAACSEVLDNPKLVVFLVDVIRPFGNELNRAGGKKDATGIKISGLVKLAATKTADNSMTSLYYIVSVLAQHQPDLLSLINEFGMCQRATKLSMQGTEQNLSACIKAAKKVEASLQIAEKEKDEVFCAAIGPFAAQVSAAVASMESRMASLKESILKVAEYLGEKEKTDKIDPIAKPETLFAAWHEFINLLLTTFNEYKKKMADLVSSGQPWRRCSLMRLTLPHRPLMIALPRMSHPNNTVRPRPAGEEAQGGGSESEEGSRGRGEEGGRGSQGRGGR